MLIWESLFKNQQSIKSKRYRLKIKRTKFTSSRKRKSDHSASTTSWAKIKMKLLSTHFWSSLTATRLAHQATSSPSFLAKIIALRSGEKVGRHFQTINYSKLSLQKLAFLALFRELENRFQRQRYLTPSDRDNVAENLGLTSTQVRNWTNDLKTFLLGHNLVPKSPSKIKKRQRWSLPEMSKSKKIARNRHWRWFSSSKD